MCVFARARAHVQIPGGFKPLIIPVGGTQVLYFSIRKTERDCVCARAYLRVYVLVCVCVCLCARACIEPLMTTLLKHGNREPTLTDPRPLSQSALVTKTLKLKP